MLVAYFFLMAQCCPASATDYTLKRVFEVKLNLIIIFYHLKPKPYNRMHHTKSESLKQVLMFVSVSHLHHNSADTVNLLQLLHNMCF